VIRVPLEEATKVTEVKQLVGNARMALPKRDATVSVSTLPPTERAIHFLADALERLVDDSSAFAVPTLQFNSMPSLEPAEIEKLYDRITERTGDSPTPGQRKFVISFPEIELSVGEVWPNGDAPDEPTPADVIEQMRDSNGMGVMGVVSEWLLIENLFVKYRGDEESEVEWDGS
jgi:hypothetical protein